MVIFSQRNLWDSVRTQFRLLRRKSEKLEGKLQGSFGFEEVVIVCLPELPPQVRKWRPGLAVS